MARGKVATKQDADGRWRFGVPGILKKRSNNDFYWSWSLKTYPTKAAAMRAGRGHLGSYQYMHNQGGSR